VCIPKLGALRLIATPCKFYKKLGKIKVGNVELYTPYPIEDYLEFSYEDWRDPTKRDHSPTYYELHLKDGKYVENEAVIFRSP